MGLFSSKSRSTTNQFDNRAAADNGSVVATGDSSIDLTQISTPDEAFDLVESTIGSAFSALKQSNDHADQIARVALGQASDAQQSDLKEIMQNAVPLGLLVLGIYAWRKYG